MALGGLLSIAGAGCSCSKSAGADGDPAPGAADASASATAPAGPPASLDALLLEGAPVITGERGPAQPALRCSECHGPIHADWSGSGHARSDTSPLYLAMRQHTPPAACDPCHAPLRSLTEPGDPVAAEGITCDVCHTLREVDLTGPRARLDFGLADNLRRGTLCDAQHHYFHKTMCSPLFRESQLCAGCHRWSLRPPVGRLIPVLTEYDEWSASPAAAAGTSCQGCHMPKREDEVATGWKRTALIGDHGMMNAGTMRRGAAAVRLLAEERHGALHAEVILTNRGNGHRLPTGFPGRQLVLEVTALDAAGGEVAREVRTYARVLVDAGGREVPFYAAVAEASDNRLAPGEARRETFSFRAGVASALRARVLWRRLSPALAAALGQPTPTEERALAEARLRLSAASTASTAPAAPAARPSRPSSP